MRASRMRDERMTRDSLSAMNGAGGVGRWERRRPAHGGPRHPPPRNVPRPPQRARPRPAQPSASGSGTSSSNTTTGSGSGSSSTTGTSSSSTTGTSSSSTTTGSSATATHPRANHCGFSDRRTAGVVIGDSADARVDDGRRRHKGRKHRAVQRDHLQGARAPCRVLEVGRDENRECDRAAPYDRRYSADR